MDEYNINNMQKINSKNYIKINQEKTLRSKKPKNKKIKQLNNLNYGNYLDESAPNRKSNFSKYALFNTNYPINENYRETSLVYPKTTQISSDINNINSLPKFSIYHPIIKNVINDSEKKITKSNFSHRSTEPFSNRNNYNHSYADNNNTNNKEMQNNYNINLLNENKINEYKSSENEILKKININSNYIKLYNTENNNFINQNNYFQNDLNKKSIKELNNNKSNEQIKNLVYKSKITNTNKNNDIYNNSNFKSIKNIGINNEKENMTLKKNIVNNNEISGGESYLKPNINQQNKLNNINIMQRFEQKNKQIKMLYLKIQKLKNDLQLMNMKNSNLSKLLTKKNMDLLAYQKGEVEQEKKIEQLTSQLLRQNFSNPTIQNNKNKIDDIKRDGKMNQGEENDGVKNIDKLISQINFLENEIKIKNSKIKEINEENEKKNRQINELVKKLHENQINNKGKKSEEKPREEEFKEIMSKFYNCQTEKLNLLKSLDNKEKEIKSNKNKISDLKNELEQNIQLIKQKDLEIEKYRNDIKTLTSQLNSKIDIINNSNKEDNVLLKKIEELSNENNKLLNQINIINSKYNNQKKLLSENNKKLKEMQELSKSLIEKEKLKLIEEKKKKQINPEKFNIITNKRFKNLIWYLIYKKPIDNKKNDREENNYDNYFWVTNIEIKNDDLKNYNKFEDDNDKNKKLEEYVINLQNKLEKKEESINKLDYQNKKLAKELLNKTANFKGNILLKKNSKEENLANSFNNDKSIENEKKYKNLLENFNKREKHLNNQITILKEQLNEKKNLENNFPHDMRNIDPHLHDSGFLDDDSEENNKNIGIKQFVSGDIKDNNNSINNNKNKIDVNNDININNNEVDNNINDNEINNINMGNMDLNENISNGAELNNSNKLSSKEDPFKESEKKVDEFLMNGAGDEDDFDEVKIIAKQMNFLKEEIKENREKNQKLGNEIKDLFLKIKCNEKNRKNIVQICQLLGFSPQFVEQIILNKKVKK